MASDRVAARRRRGWREGGVEHEAGYNEGDDLQPFRNGQEELFERAAALDLYPRPGQGVEFAVETGTVPRAGFVVIEPLLMARFVPAVAEHEHRDRGGRPPTVTIVVPGFVPERDRDVQQQHQHHDYQHSFSHHGIPLFKGTLGQTTS